MDTQPGNDSFDQPPGSPATSGTKPAGRRWLRRLLYGLVALFVLAGLVLVLAGTGPVLRFAAPTINRTVGAAIDGRFETEGIRGSLWTGLSLDHLALEMEATGLEVEIRRLELLWSPRALLGGTIQIDRLAAASLAVVLPHSGTAAQDQKEPPGDSGPLDLPLALRLGQLALPDIRLTDPASGSVFTYALEASAAAAQDLTTDFSLALTPLAGSGDRLRARLAFKADSRELEAEVDGRIGRAGMVMTLAGVRPEEAADITVSLQGEGPADTWQGDLALAAADMAELSGQIGIELGDKEISFSYAGAVTTLGKLAEQVPAPLRGAFGVDLAGRFDTAAKRLALTRFDLARPDLLAVSVKADVDLAASRIGASLEAEIADLSVVTALTGLELSGAGHVAVTDVDWSAAGGGQADIAITGRGLAFGNADLDRLVGPEPAIAARLKMSPQLDMGITIDRLDLATVTGTATIDVMEDFKEMKVAAEVAVQPGALPPAAGVTLPADARLKVALEGPVTAPAGTIRLTAAALETAGRRFDNIELASTLTWSEKQVLALQNRLEVLVLDNPYRLDVDAVLPPEGVQLAMTLNGEGLDLAGRFELPGNDLPVRGAVKLARLDAGLLGDLGVPLAAGRLEANIDFLPVEGRQRIDLDAAGNGLRLAAGDGGNPPAIDRLALHGRVDDALGEPVMTLQLDGTGMTAGQTVVERLEAALQGTPGKMRLSVETAGRIEDRLPLTLAASADLDLEGDVRVSVDRFDADIAHQMVSVPRPLQVTRSTTGTLDATATLALEDGLIDATLHLVPEREFDLRADLRDLALGPWAAVFGQQDLAGTLSLTARVNERAGKAPQAELSGTMKDIRIAGNPQAPPFSLHLAGTVRERQAEAQLSLGHEDRRDIEARALVPINLSLLKGQGGIDADAPLSVHADLDSEIARFWPYVPLPDHLLSGRIKLVADLSGSLSDPSWEGVLTLEDGSYENLQFGTLLRHIRLDGRFDRGGMRITELSADDGGKGTLTGHAEVVLGDAAAVTYRGEITMRDAAVVRMDELQLWTDINLSVAGDSNAATIDSEITVSHGEVDLAVALPASVPQLDVVYLDQPGREATAEKQDATAPFTAILDATVKIPGRLFLRGKGLDSEWGGRLDISGAADSPKIVGELRARRGRLDVLGKTFSIRESQISFLGGQPPDPLLDIVGVYTVEDLLVTAALTGPASDVKLALTSVPDMPQDEILSRVLFGKAQGSLSTFEALQLAAAAAELAGKGGGLNVVGSLRKSLGADVMRVEGGEGGPNVEVGKYLTEGVYVGTKRGTAPGSTGVEVEIELTPHIKATSESTEIDNKAGLQFKWDY
ncbi:translocation/assembly module TamB domain-containing protein [Desulfoprunum benzoelyticum]|uniref:Translocation and assembly module TamB n=1 Tax=Desulfoprunum benzoelyticum TaxID=1506996 RepID=A0A840US93_9BACT|nr:translocation/assembly module TamB domain-containing protein [Desulfoprunum benzoelyticum]MBB5348662.1 translocation and assembly module TamB [Desulfoprunum benzoelyticum]MBM9530059.1 translocation/assembly module TamB domain-containing protein [Desulfoprunum benzoelyticum]